MNKLRKQCSDLETDQSSNTSLQDLSFKTSLNVSASPSSSTTASGSDFGGFTKTNIGSLLENEEIEKIADLSLSSVSSNNDDSGGSFRSSCLSKPHKGNDIRWEAIKYVKGEDGELGLSHFRLLKKLGFGDIGSVYLAELRGMGCLFAMKVMDKGMLESRKKLLRAQTEREILGLLDHPFLPTLYSHFETNKFACLLMEFCNGGDLHILRQRQPNKHFSEQAARFLIFTFILF